MPSATTARRRGTTSASRGSREQWPDAIVRQRQLEGRPCLTINRLPAFIRQVVNDARQVKPSVKVHPVDSTADPETAEIFDGLIRHIEYSSNADVAYDTAIESAVGMGFGYWRVGLDHADSDTFDLDIRIDRVADPFTIYGDPESTAADSSDWNSAFVVERMRKSAFQSAWRGAKATDWSAGGKHTGRTDVPLNALGRKQAEALGAGLERLDIVFDAAVIGLDGVSFTSALGDESAFEVLTSTTSGPGLVDLAAVSLLSDAALLALQEGTR